MDKALIITSVASMVDQFLLPSMFLLQNMGYEVHVACNFEKGNTCLFPKENFQTLLLRRWLHAVVVKEVLCAAFFQESAFLLSRKVHR